MRISFLGAGFALAAGLTITASVGCGLSPITPPRIEAAIATTFSNLVELQVTWLGLPAMTASEFAVKASCSRVLGGNIGSGDWVCTLVWLSPDRQTLRDTYDLFVGTDGCYSAAAEGSNLGGPTLKTGDGREVRNLLFAFEGCFDTTS